MAPKIVCVVGPTACGKTTLGVLLAKKFNGEVVSADSMQIYRGMTIGTAAPTEKEMDGVLHHMVAVADPAEQWSAARYAETAIPIIDDILARGKLPVLVGGTGLWLDAVVKGHGFAGGHAGSEVRKTLQERLEAEGIEPLLEELRQVDPEAARRLHPADEKRILRALEVYLETGKTITAHNAETKDLPPRYDAVWIGLRFADRQDMKALIDRRVDKWPAPGCHGPPGHRLQGVFGSSGGHRHRGGGSGGGEAPLPAIRQAPAHLAAAKSGHPLDRMGKRTGFCAGPTGFDGNPDRRGRILALRRTKQETIVRPTKKKGADDMQNKANLQDIFLLRAKRDKLPVTMFLMNGFQMRGVITGFDAFVVILDSEGRQQVIYKHAISTIAPVRPVDLREEET